jgi:hypothetical protein
MPMISGGHKALLHYPDGTSTVITLYALPLTGQMIAHGWEVTNVAPGEDDVAGVPIEYEISVARPAERASGDGPSAFIVTRIHVGDYDTWKPMFDKDEPGTRHAAKGHRVLRSLDDPNEVYVLVEFASSDAANAAREKLLAAGVLDRFSDKTLPRVVEEAETVTYSGTADAAAPG